MLEGCLPGAAGSCPEPEPVPPLPLSRLAPWELSPAHGAARAKRPPAQSKELLSAKAGVGLGSASVPVEQGAGPLIPALSALAEPQHLAALQAAQAHEAQDPPAAGTGLSVLVHAGG